MHAHLKIKLLLKHCVQQPPVLTHKCLVHTVVRAHDVADVCVDGLRKRLPLGFVEGVVIDGG